MTTCKYLERCYAAVTIAMVFIITVHPKEIHGKGLETRIINGTLADWEGTYYQVSVRWAYNDWIFGEGHRCGGTLVSANVVLTAAHCVWSYFSDNVMNAESLIVVMGNLDRFVQDEGTVQVGVANIIITSEFQSQSLHEDLAILILNQTVPLNNGKIRTIEINENYHFRDGTMCTVSGWGLTENNVTSNKLKVLKVPLLNTDDCIRYYDEQLIRAGKICAGFVEGGRDACIGDSGGPLVCNNVLVGIVSGGLQCAKPGKPGIYTDVSYYYKNIQAAINEAEHRKPEEDSDDHTNGVVEQLTTVQPLGSPNSATGIVNSLLWMYLFYFVHLSYCFNVE